MKWVILGVVALGAVIAVAVAVTVVVLHSNSGSESKGPNASTAGSASGIASANDQGVVTVITQDPSCGAWVSIDKALTTSADNGWSQRDPSIPATAWTPEQHAQYQAVGQAMRTAADQSVALAKLTPHRVMRELFAQFIVYARDYADHIPNYRPSDDGLARVANSAVSALGAICDAVIFDSAAKRGPLVSPTAPPKQTAFPGDPASPQRFLTSSNPACADWVSMSVQFDNETAAWRNEDPNTPASQWTPEQTTTNKGAASKMSAFAEKARQLGDRSGNPTFSDFAGLSAQYYRAFVVAVPTYVLTDNYLANVGAYASATIRSACEAVGGQ